MRRETIIGARARVHVQRLQIVSVLFFFVVVVVVLRLPLCGRGISQQPALLGCLLAAKRTSYLCNKNAHARARLVASSLFASYTNIRSGAGDGEGEGGTARVYIQYIYHQPI